MFQLTGLGEGRGAWGQSTKVGQISRPLTAQPGL